MNNFETKANVCLHIYTLLFIRSGTGRPASIMTFHKINRSCSRCRFIVHIADWSALRGCFGLRCILWKLIMGRDGSAVPFQIIGRHIVKVYMFVCYKWNKQQAELVSKNLPVKTGLSWSPCQENTVHYHIGSQTYIIMRH